MARGATQAAAAGAARWPHHLKRQERSCESRGGGGLRWRWEAGSGLPRWRERREQRRRNAGRAGDEPGLPRAPRTHRRASAGRVCVRRALCSSSAPLRIRKGVEPASGCCGLRGFLPAGCPGSGVLEPAVVFTGGSQSRSRSRWASGGLGLGSSRARPPPRGVRAALSHPVRAAFGAGLGTRRAEVGGGGGFWPRSLFLWEEIEKFLGREVSRRSWALLWGKHCGANLGPWGSFQA